MSLYKVSSIRLAYERTNDSRNKLVEALSKWSPDSRLPKIDMYFSPKFDIDEEKQFFPITTDLLRTHQVNVIDRRNIGFRALTLIPARTRYISRDLECT